MIEKLRKAYLAYQKAGGEKPKGQFFRTDSETGKKSLVRISHNDEGALSLDLNLANDQVHAELRRDLDAILSAPLPAVQLNDHVILLAAGAAPQPGQVFQLSAQDRYFAINGGPILCNGRPLGSDHPARFLNRFTARCAPNAATQYYDEFRLL